MATDLITTGKADGSMRELARLALSTEWTSEKGMAVLNGANPQDAIAAYEAGLKPLAEAEPNFDGPGSKGLRDWLKPIGMKISPSMAPEVCSTWLTAVVMALSDFPAKVATQAARNAIRTPMQFLNEVDGHVRAEAEKLMETHRYALRRLRWMKEDIERAAKPQQPQIASPGEDGRPLTNAEIRALAPTFRRIGLANGWLTQEQIDAADAETSTPFDMTKDAA